MNLLQLRFLKDLYEPWVEAALGDEWGEYVEALWRLVDAALAIDEQDQAETILGWLATQLERWAEDDWGENWTERVADAQAAYDDIVRIHLHEYGPSARAWVDEVIETLPEWIRVDPEAPTARVDPEYEQYLKLKAKFEKLEDR